MGPYTVLRWIGANSYVLDLLGDVWISPIFNIADLLPYHAPDQHSDSPNPTIPSDSVLVDSPDDHGCDYGINAVQI